MYGRSKSEEFANACVHLPVVVYSLSKILEGNSNFVFFAISSLTFLFSAIYHLFPESSGKRIARRWDVASIFWLIPASVFHLLPVHLGVSFLVLTATMSFPVIKSETATIFTDVTLITIAVACTAIGCLFSSQWEIVAIGTLIYAAGLPFYFASYTNWLHFVWHIFVICGWCTHASLYIT